VSSPNKLYFLDKCPGYAGLASDLIQTFPDGKFIFLWRNPLAIADSWLRASENGRWRIERFAYELYTELPHLLDASLMSEGRSVSIRYEDLVSSPQRILETICQYLGISFQDKMVTCFAETHFTGGLASYEEVGIHVRRESLCRWQANFARPVRRRWARKYLNWLGESRLNLMGYSQSDLLAKLNRHEWMIGASAVDLVVLLHERIRQPQRRSNRRHRSRPEDSTSVRLHHVQS